MLLFYFSPNEFMILLIKQNICLKKNRLNVNNGHGGHDKNEITSLIKVSKRASFLASYQHSN